MVQLVRFGPHKLLKCGGCGNMRLINNWLVWYYARGMCVSAECGYGAAAERPNSCNKQVSMQG